MNRQSIALPLSIYRPLVQGGEWLYDATFSNTNLDAVWTAYGGYWSLSFTVEGSQLIVEEWLEEGLGRHIEMSSPALEIAWDGFVSSVTANIGALSITRGPLLDTVANEIMVEFSTVDTSTTPPTMGIRASTPWAFHADSQAKYGIILRVISLSGASPANAAQVRDMAIDEFAEPQMDEQDNLSSSAHPSATINCLGYFHWLDAYTVGLTTVGDQDADAKMQAVLAADPNAIFSTDYSRIASNTTQVGAYDVDNRKAATVIKGLVSLGDTTNARWLFGFGAGRQAIYRAAPTDPIYQRRLGSPEQVLGTYGDGGRVQPWSAQPGERVLYTDLLIGKSEQVDIKDDPRYLFIEQATFTAPWGLALDGARVGRLDQFLAQLGLGGTSA